MEDIHKSASPITATLCDCRIEASIDTIIDSIWVAVLNLDKNNVLKLRPENSVASRIPEIMISRQSITDAGMMA